MVETKITLSEKDIAGLVDAELRFAEERRQVLGELVGMFRTRENKALMANDPHAFCTGLAEILPSFMRRYDDIERRAAIPRLVKNGVA